MGLGPSRWDSVFFVEVKCIFSTTSEVKIFSKSKEKEVVEETEAKEDHWCDRTRSRHDRRNRLVAAAVRARDARVCNRRVRSLAEPERSVTHLGNSACLRVDRTRWHV
jgi:hypothetical protein